MHRRNWRMYKGLLFATRRLTQNAAAPRIISGSEAQNQFFTNHPQLPAGKRTIGRGKQLNCLNRIWARLAAARQVNFAVGSEVIR